MGYQHQLHRVIRWLYKAQEKSSYWPINRNNPPRRRGPQEYEDYLYALFQNCWHLKDWIRNDSAAPKALRDAVEQTVHKQCTVVALALCADLANGSKHLTLDKLVRRGAKLIRDTGDFEMDEDGKNAKETYKCKVTDDSGKEYDALELAHQALAEWEKLIIDNGGSLSWSTIDDYYA